MARLTRGNYWLASLLLRGSLPSVQRLLLLSAAGIVLLGGCASHSQTGKQVEETDGKVLYAANCASCHGEDGHNDRQGANPAMRLTNADALPDNDWEALVRNGRNEMPAFHNRISPGEIRALRDYVRQLGKPGS